MDHKSRYGLRSFGLILQIFQFDNRRPHTWHAAFPITSLFFLKSLSVASQEFVKLLQTHCLPLPLANYCHPPYHGADLSATTAALLHDLFTNTVLSCWGEGEKWQKPVLRGSKLTRTINLKLSLRLQQAGDLISSQGTFKPRVAQDQARLSL